MKKKVFVVTGGAGFIGNNLIKRLNQNGIDDIIIIDNLDKKEKWRNLGELSFYDFIDYKIGINKIIESLNKIRIKTIFHLGANSDVLSSDNSQMIYYNFYHSKKWLSYAYDIKTNFIFASSSAVYGNTLSLMKKNNPHNIYALSKWMFDNYVKKNLKELQTNIKIIGLRFFNNYGWGEFHKDKNASLVYRFFKFLIEENKITLFQNAKDIKRDYMWVNDTVNLIIKLLSREVKNGIYDLGTGKPLSHFKLALLIIHFLKKNKIINPKKQDEYYYTFIDFPEYLKGKFQFYTKAKIPYWYSKEDITDRKKGIEKYLKQLIEREKEKNDN